MSDLVLHPLTAQQLESFISHPAHALLLTGAAGIGKGSVARYLAQTLIDDTADITTHPYVRIIMPNDAAISIEAVRSL